MPPSTIMPSAVVLVVAQRLNSPASQYSQSPQPKIASIATARPSSVTSGELMALDERAAVLDVHEVRRADARRPDRDQLAGAVGLVDVDDGHTGRGGSHGSHAEVLHPDRPGAHGARTPYDAPVAGGPLHVEREPGIAVVTIDAPPLQLVDGPLLRGALRLLPELEADDDLRVCVFRSADPDFFLMHADVEALIASTPWPRATATEPNIAAATFERIHREPFVTIGVLDGAARGGGCEFLSALDLRLGTPRSVIGQPEVPLGILPGAGGTVRWARLVGRTQALELLLTGRRHPRRGSPRTRLAARDPRSRRRRRRRPRPRPLDRPYVPASVAAVKRVVDVALGRTPKRWWPRATR